MSFIITRETSLDSQWIWAGRVDKTRFYTTLTTELKATALGVMTRLRAARFYPPDLANAHIEGDATINVEVLPDSGVIKYNVDGIDDQTITADQRKINSTALKIAQKAFTWRMAPLTPDVKKAYWLDIVLTIDPG